MKHEITTMEHLQMHISPSYGAVLKFGSNVLFTDYHWKGGFTAKVYEFIETPEETGLGNIECRISLIAEATGVFPDNGHAIAWCMNQ